MAQLVKVFLVDDLDGSEGAETVRFGLDGTAYEIDLSPANAERLRKSLAKWTEFARRLPSRGPKAGRSATRAANPARRAVNSGEMAKIRTWARSQGLEISDRGRIPVPIQESYYAATREA